jgi:hypothetical protein
MRVRRIGAAVPTGALRALAPAPSAAANVGFSAPSSKIDLLNAFTAAAQAGVRRLVTLGGTRKAEGGGVLSEQHQPQLEEPRGEEARREMLAAAAGDVGADGGGGAGVGLMIDSYQSLRWVSSPNPARGGGSGSGSGSGALSGGPPALPGPSAGPLTVTRTSPGSGDRQHSPLQLPAASQAASVDSLTLSEQAAASPAAPGSPPSSPFAPTPRQESPEALHAPARFELGMYRARARTMDRI